MHTIQVNGIQYTVEPGPEPGQVRLDGRVLTLDARSAGPGVFHLLIDGRSCFAEVGTPTGGDKSFVVRVNNRPYAVRVADPYDALLHRLGMDADTQPRANDLKAPMPGLVVAVHVQPGQVVAAGDRLVSLEAMKMENSLKAGGDGTVTEVCVRQGQTVEKGEVLIRLA